MSPGKHGGSGKKSKVRAASSSPEMDKKNKKEKTDSAADGGAGGGMEISNPDDLKGDKSSDGDKMRIKHHEQTIEAALSVSFGGEAPNFVHEDERNSQVPDLGPALTPINVPGQLVVPPGVTLQSVPERDVIEDRINTLEQHMKGVTEDNADRLTSAEEENKSLVSRTNKVEEDVKKLQETFSNLANDLSQYSQQMANGVNQISDKASKKAVEDVKAAISTEVNSKVEEIKRSVTQELGSVQGASLMTLREEFNTFKSSIISMLEQEKEAREKIETELQSFKDKTDERISDLDLDNAVQNQLSAEEVEWVRNHKRFESDNYFLHTISIKGFSGADAASNDSDRYKAKSILRIDNLSYIVDRATRVYILPSGTGDAGQNRGPALRLTYRDAYEMTAAFKSIGEAGRGIRNAGGHGPGLKLSYQQMTPPRFGLARRFLNQLLTERKRRKEITSFSYFVSKNALMARVTAPGKSPEIVKLNVEPNEQDVAAVQRGDVGAQLAALAGQPLPVAAQEQLGMGGQDGAQALAQVPAPAPAPDSAALHPATAAGQAAAARANQQIVNVDEMEVEQGPRDVQCAICSKDMQGHSKRLECGHAFHDMCIKFAWGHGPVSCPTCREVPVQTQRATERLVRADGPCDGCYNESGTISEEEMNSERRISPKCGHLHLRRCFYRHLNTEGLFFPGTNEEGEALGVNNEILAQLCISDAHGCAMCAVFNGSNSPNLHEVAAWKDNDCSAFTLTTNAVTAAAPRIQIQRVSGGQELGAARQRVSAGAGTRERDNAAAGTRERDSAATGARHRDRAPAGAGERRRSPDSRQHRDRSRHQSRHRSPRRDDNFRPRSPPHRRHYPRRDQRPWSPPHTSGAGYRNDRIDRGYYSNGQTRRG